VLQGDLNTRQGLSANPASRTYPFHVVLVSKAASDTHVMDIIHDDQQLPRRTPRNPPAVRYRTKSPRFVSLVLCQSRQIRTNLAMVNCKQLQAPQKFADSRTYNAPSRMTAGRKTARVCAAR
jgi:hypothetical protein